MHASARPGDHRPAIGERSRTVPRSQWRSTGVPPASAKRIATWLVALIAPVALLAMALGPVGPGALPASATAAAAATVARSASAAERADASTVPGATVWLCRPGAPDDPCTASLQKSVVTASGTTSVVNPQVDAASNFDCFYVYPTVSRETTANSDLRVQRAEKVAAIAQASPFSTLCRVWAPMYRQVTLDHLSLSLTSSSPEMVTAYQSLVAGFDDFLAHYNHGRPIILIGHSQGSSIVTLLLQRLVESDAALRSRLVLAIVPGGNVVVPTGLLVGGSFSRFPLCSSTGETGCVIAYSTFPGEPPATSFFGRPGQGVSLMSGQTARTGVQVACVNPAALSGGSAELDPLFPTPGLLSTPWVEYPQLYSARCESAGGATWLQVTKITGKSDRRPVVTEQAGPDWGYHLDDINLPLGNLLSDTAAAETTWSKSPHPRVNS